MTQRETRKDQEKPRAATKRTPRDEVDEQSEQSFPASDPPSFTPMTGYGPEHLEAEERLAERTA